MKNLFIDSNIWLSLYHFSKNDLNQFSKLQNHLGKNIQLWIPQQVVDEVFRNRDAKIKDALSSFKDWKRPPLPNFCKGYEEYSKFSDALAELEKYHKRWMSKILDDFHEQSLPADNVINLLFNSVEISTCPSRTVHAAALRYRIGNPPGKDNKLGDAINWECLLENIPQQEDLYFISNDSDYQSAMDKNCFNLFLDLEWKEKKKSEIHYYPDLVSFLDEHIKDISLQDEREKEELIHELKSIPSYASTHAYIRQLGQYQDWTSGQIERICEAAIQNSQIGDILEDPDVRDFFKHLLSSISENTENIMKIRRRLLPLTPPPPPPSPPLLKYLLGN